MVKVKVKDSIAKNFKLPILIIFLMLSIFIYYKVYNLKILTDLKIKYNMQIFFGSLIIFGMFTLKIILDILGLVFGRTKKGSISDNIK